MEGPEEEEEEVKHRMTILLHLPFIIIQTDVTHRVKNCFVLNVFIFSDSTHCYSIFCCISRTHKCYCQYNLHILFSFSIIFINVLPPMT